VAVIKPFIGSAPRVIRRSMKAKGTVPITIVLAVIQVPLVKVLLAVLLLPTNLQVRILLIIVAILLVQRRLPQLKKQQKE
jgi:uncharacterized membrane protein